MTDLPKWGVEWIFHSLSQVLQALSCKIDEKVCEDETEDTKTDNNDDGDIQGSIDVSKEVVRGNEDKNIQREADEFIREVSTKSDVLITSGWALQFRSEECSSDIFNGKK